MRICDQNCDQNSHWILRVSAVGSWIARGLAVITSRATLLVILHLISTEFSWNFHFARDQTTPNQQRPSAATLPNQLP